jgi:aspartate aminotransferase
MRHALFRDIPDGRGDSGGGQCVNVAFRALLDPGDEVIFSLPPWFLYEPMPLAAFARPVKVRVRPGGR